MASYPLAMTTAHDLSWVAEYSANVPRIVVGMAGSILLAERGRRMHDWPEWTWLAGTAEAILTDPNTGMVGAGADPRRPACTIAV